MAINGSSHRATLAARPESAGAARVLIRGWLNAARQPEQVIDDVVYAVNEAVTNAVEHAYTPSEAVHTIEPTSGIEHDVDGNRRARIHVGDHGRWRPPPCNPGFRGYGLNLMQALMDEVNIQPGDGHHGGTVAALLNPPVPAVPQ